jgi:Rrf2 family transcriptional regulator, cysteine metabolism repressor
MQGISSKGMYALSAMHVLVHAPNLQSMQAKEMASMIDVSPAYLEQILSKLKKSGILSSIRGARGGFTFAKEIDDIFVIDILKAVENRLFVSKPYGNQSAIISSFWRDMQEKTESLFRVKLTELDMAYHPLMYEI